MNSKTTYSAPLKLQKQCSISIVIPTYNRPKDVRELLDSILKQTELPNEIIIVDDSIISETEEIVNEMKPSLSNKKIDIIYKRGDPNSKKGICLARNLGNLYATGDIVFFIDDDVVLDRHYIEEILKVYEQKTGAKGVQGDIGHPNFSMFFHAVNKIFSLYYPEKGKCRVLRSGGLTFPYALTETTECDWISGTNSTYKKEVLRKFQWDEKLGEYSLYDDVDLSLNVSKHYPHSLYITPRAKIVHKVSSSGRRNLKIDAYIRTIYPIYFFNKNIEKKARNKLSFIWSMIGRFFINFFWRKNATQLLHLLSAYIYTLRHYAEITEGTFIFLNKK